VACPVERDARAVLGPEMAIIRAAPACGPLVGG
jgi:hypothetical protein